MIMGIYYQNKNLTPDKNEDHRKSLKMIKRSKIMELLLYQVRVNPFVDEIEDIRFLDEDELVNYQKIIRFKYSRRRLNTRNKEDEIYFLPPETQVRLYNEGSLRILIEGNCKKIADEVGLPS